MNLKPEINLFEHQKKFAEMSNQCDYVLLGDEMGLGKTLSAISVSEGNVLVVCPAFLKYNWKAEFLKFTTLKESEIAIDKAGSRVTITSYSKLKKAKEWFMSADHVIADEAHYLKNIEAKRTQMFHSYVREGLPTKLTLLTGTPVKNRVEEFYSLLTLLSYCPSSKNGLKIYNKFRTQYSFSKHFSHERSFDINVYGRRVTVKKFEGLKNESELKTYFRGKYIRRLTKDVIVLPELLERYVDVNYKYDDKALEEFEHFKGKIEDHIMAIKRGSAMAKAPFTADYAKNIFDETGRPVVIFSDHVDPVDIISGKLKRSGIITGKTPMPQRHSIVEAFQSGQLDYLVATIGAASTGLTLTASSDLIFNDMSYVPANNAQASKRIHRIGQENSCRIHRMCGSHIDKAIMIALTSKQSVLDRII